MIKSFNLATTPERFEFALNTIKSIYEQADVIRIYLNNFITVPKELIDKKIVTKLGPDMCCSGRLIWSEIPDQYYFIIDDDILYPKNYSLDMIHSLNFFKKEAFISLHGKIMKKNKISSYFNDVLESFNFQFGFPKNRYVHVIGAGVSLFNTNHVKIKLDNFKYNYMDDIEISLQLQKQKTPAIVIAHNKNYFSSIDLFKEKGILTLHEKYKHNDKSQTNRYNELVWQINKHNIIFTLWKLNKLKIKK